MARIFPGLHTKENSWDNLPRTIQPWETNGTEFSKLLSTAYWEYCRTDAKCASVPGGGGLHSILTNSYLSLFRADLAIFATVEHCSRSCIYFFLLVTLLCHEAISVPFCTIKILQSLYKMYTKSKRCLSRQNMPHFLSSCQAV